MESSEKLAEDLAPPTEIGSESYAVAHHTGRRGWNPFVNLNLVVEHQPSSFAPNNKWSNKGISPSIPP
jgi:hypothetical protein